MAEYVSKVELKERIRYDFDYSLQLCEDIIESIDSILAINNVHCENCIHYFPDDEEENFGECLKLRDNVSGDDATSVYVDGNFFCKMGERKE